MSCPTSIPVPAESRPPSDTAQEHHWLPKAMMSLNTFLTLSCMVLLALGLVKSEWGVSFCWQRKGLGAVWRGPQKLGRSSAAPDCRIQVILKFF